MSRCSWNIGFSCRRTSMPCRPRKHTEVANEFERRSTGAATGPGRSLHSGSSRRNCANSASGTRSRSQIAKARRRPCATRTAARTSSSRPLRHELRNPLAPIRQARAHLKGSGCDRGAEALEPRCDRPVRFSTCRCCSTICSIFRESRGGRSCCRMQSTELASVIEAAVETARPTIDGKTSRVVGRHATRAGALHGGSPAPGAGARQPPDECGEIHRPGG